MASSGKRSSFLNILTILSFVGIALYTGVGVFMVLSGVGLEKTVFQSDETFDGARLTIMKDQSIEPEQREQAIHMLSLSRYLKPAGIMVIFAQIFCLLGVLKMRKQNKEGFALYCVGELGVPIAMVTFFGGLGAATFIVAIIFTGLYASRLGEMSLSKQIA